MQRHVMHFAPTGFAAPHARAQAPSDAKRYASGPHMIWWGGGWYAMIFDPLLMILFLAVLNLAAATVAADKVLVF